VLPAIAENTLLGDVGSQLSDDGPAQAADDAGFGHSLLPALRGSYAGGSPSSGGSGGPGARPPVEAARGPELPQALDPDELEEVRAQARAEGMSEEEVDELEAEYVWAHANGEMDDPAGGGGGIGDAIDEDRRGGCKCGRPLIPEALPNGITTFKEKCICGEDGPAIGKVDGVGGNVHGFQGI